MVVRPGNPGRTLIRSIVAGQFFFHLAIQRGHAFDMGLYQLLHCLVPVYDFTLLHHDNAGRILDVENTGLLVLVRHAIDQLFR